MSPTPNITENISSVPHYSSVTLKLGLTAVASDEELADIVEQQLPVESLKFLESSGILDTEIYSLIIPRRTLAHRKARHERLSKDESDRAVRLARIAALTEEIFGDREKAFRWLRKPKLRLRGRSPISMLDTDAGSRLVEDMLYRLDYGMAA